MDKPKRFYTHEKKIYFTYKMSYGETEEYHGWDEYALVFGIAESWFGREEWYYDGHSFKGFVVFGLMFAKMFTYTWDRK